MNDFSAFEGLDNSFYPEFFNEGLYVVRERGLEEKSSVRQNRSVEMEKESSVLPFNDRKKPKTLLLFNYPGANSIPEADRAFVAKVLDAARQDFDEAEKLVINSGAFTAWSEISACDGPDVVLAFGLPAPLFPQGAEEGKVMQTDNKKILCMGSPAGIAANNSLKRLLWEGLKEIYQL